VNILLINQNWFAEEFKILGHRVISYGHFEWLDYQETKPILRWDEILQRLPHDFSPDLVFFYDDSAAINILGLEQIKIPTIFYSVDTHHHQNFHTQLGLFFTHTFVAQKDYLQEFSKIGIPAKWLPLWASRNLSPDENKDFEAVFVGTLNSALNPERVQFFEQLQKISDIKVVSGDFSSIFPKSKIVVNQTVKKDLNFRVFEAMISGAMLLTEQIENGLNDLFVDGQELVSYEKGNVKDVAEKISYYLANPELAKQIGLAGREKILKSHLAINRAEYILQSLSENLRSEHQPNYLGLAANFVTLGRSSQKSENKILATAFIFEALRLIKLGAELGHSIHGEMPMFVLTAIFDARGYLSNQAIIDFFDLLIEHYPEQLIFRIAKLGFLSETNESERAQALASELNPASVDAVIASATGFVKFFNRQLGPS
jgi:hypothetical protein